MALEKGPDMQLSPSAHADTFCRDNLPAADQMPDLDLSLGGLSYPVRLNAADELLNPTIEGGAASRRCLLSPGQTWSYGELAARASQVARVLTEDLGLIPGNRVLLRGPNNPWLAACWLGVLKAGGVAVATMPMLRSGELAAICGVAKVSVALCDYRFTDELAAAAVPGLRTVTFGGNAPDDLTMLARAKTAQFSSVQTAADDVAIIAFTSGTTGQPKASMHFHRDLLAVADTFSAHVLKPLPDDLFAGRACRLDRSARRHRPVHRPYGVPGHAGGGQGRSAARPAPGGISWRAPARPDLAGVPSGDLHQDHRWHR